MSTPVATSTELCSTGFNQARSENTHLRDLTGKAPSNVNKIVETISFGMVAYQERTHVSQTTLKHKQQLSEFLWKLVLAGCDAEKHGVSRINDVRHDESSENASPTRTIKIATTRHQKRPRNGDARRCDCGCSPVNSCPKRLIRQARFVRTASFTSCTALSANPLLCESLSERTLFCLDSQLQCCHCSLLQGNDSWLIVR